MRYAIVLFEYQNINFNPNLLDTIFNKNILIFKYHLYFSKKLNYLIQIEIENN